MAKDLFANMGNAKPSVRPIKFRQLEHMEKELIRPICAYIANMGRSH